MFAALVIPLALLVSVIIYMFVMGSPSNFEGGSNENHPLPGNYFGMVYKGGVIVPILMSLFLIVITFVIERYLTIVRAKGSGSIPAFMKRLQAHISNLDVDSAMQECEKQKGSISNVLLAVFSKYKEIEHNPAMDKEQKMLKLQLELEDATELELPALEKNLVILATIASVATLMGLLGTVLGMIKSFAALATAGAPDSIALANGISEALINTALGIGTSAIAIVFYNFFTTNIDGISYRIDEAGFSAIKVFKTTLDEKK